jgi:hypothetical protein
MAVIHCGRIVAACLEGPLEVADMLASWWHSLVAPFEDEYWARILVSCHRHIRVSDCFWNVFHV